MVDKSGTDTMKPINEFEHAIDFVTKYGNWFGDKCRIMVKKILKCGMIGIIIMVFGIVVFLYTFVKRLFGIKRTFDI